MKSFGELPEMNLQGPFPCSPSIVSGYGAEMSQHGIDDKD